MPKTATVARSGEVEWLGRYMDRSQFSTSLSSSPRPAPTVQQQRPPVSDDDDGGDNDDAVAELPGPAWAREWGEEAGRGWLTGRALGPWSGKNCSRHKTGTIRIWGEWATQRS